MPAASKTLTSRAREAYASPIGQKAVMAVTGLILFGFLVGHLLGNLQVFEGAEKLDGYSKLLHATGELLWGVRGVLLLALVLHVGSAVSLERHKLAARAIPYQHPKDWRSATLGSRTMFVTGVVVLAFVVYHLLHFTFGWSAVHASYEEGHVFHNVVSAFKGPGTVLIYIVSMGALGLHLSHGLWSLLQSVGVRGPTEPRKLASTVVALVLALGFALVPIAILFGVVSEHH
jgi:succinate dehydrogenase / fumarate reductase cytochrome b subunit